MNNNIGEVPIEELRELLQASRQTLTSLVDSLANRPDMQNAIRRLMRPDDMLETFSELAVREPDLMRLVLQASVAALVNVQSVETVDGAEMKEAAGQPRRFEFEVYTTDVLNKGLESWFTGPHCSRALPCPAPYANPRRHTSERPIAACRHFAMKASDHTHVHRPTL